MRYFQPVSPDRGEHDLDVVGLARDDASARDVVERNPGSAMASGSRPADLER